MGYDNRINDTNMILNCLDIDFAKDRYKNSSGYFTHDVNNYADLSRCKYGKLTDIRNGCYAYQADKDKCYSFFLPESSVKPEKNKPRTLDEVNHLYEKCVEEIMDLKSELNSVKSELKLNVEWINRVLGITK